MKYEINHGHSQHQYVRTYVNLDTLIYIFTHSQFLTLPPGDERSRLVPVLQKILALTPDETNKVHAVAKGK